MRDIPFGMSVSLSYVNLMDKKSRIGRAQNQNGENRASFFQGGFGVAKKMNPSQGCHLGFCKKAPPR